MLYDIISRICHLFVYTVIDVCALNNGNCTQSCIHEAHRRFRCDCYDGYELDTDHADCVSKCDIDGGGCSDSCELVNGVVTCGCKNGFVLDDGKKNCTGEFLLVLAYLLLAIAIISLPPWDISD